MTAALLKNPTSVIELGDSIAASYCGRMLQQLGAAVLKIEPRSGSPVRDSAPLLDSNAGRTSMTFAALNAGKEIVAADVDAPSDRSAIESMVRDRGDLVLMSGLSSEWQARGLTSDRIRELAPAAIIGRVTMFGDDGPYVHMRGGELQAQALGGLMNMIGLPGREPLRLGGYQAQYSAGLALLAGFSMATFKRTSTGEGCSFNVSVLETVAQIEWKGAVTFQDDGMVPTRSEQGDPAILRAKDGYFAFFYRPDDWPNVVALLGDPRLDEERFATTQGRDAHRAELLNILNQCTASVSKRELYHAAQAKRLPMGYMATMGDLLASEQYRARHFFDDLDLGDAGAGKIPGAPWRVANPEQHQGRVS